MFWVHTHDEDYFIYFIKIMNISPSKSIKTRIINGVNFHFILGSRRVLHPAPSTQHPAPSTQHFHLKSRFVTIVKKGRDVTVHGSVCAAGRVGCVDDGLPMLTSTVACRSHTGTEGMP